MIRIGWNKRLSCQLALAAIFGILLAEKAGWQYALCALMLAGVLLGPLLWAGNFRECAARGAMLLFAGGLAAFSFLVQERQWRECEQALLTGQEQVIRGTVVHREIKNDRRQLTLALPDGKNQMIVSTGECDDPLDSTLLVKGQVEGFGFPRNEGQFNEKTYYKSRQIIGRMRAEKVVCIRAPEGIFLWRERLSCLRMRVAQVCAKMLPEEGAGILAAMLVGETSFLDRDVNALFQSAGIGHILAISGMHVSMIGMGIYFLLRKCGFGYSVCGASTAFLLFCYGTMAGMGVSTRRAVCMFFIYLLAQCFGRGYDGPAALGAAAFVLLLYRPFLLHSVSFQYSFAAAYAVVAISGLRKEAAEKEDKEKEIGEKRAGEKGTVEKKAGKGKGLLLRALRPICAAFLLQLCILPLTAYYNYELPLYALFLNLLLLPYAGILMGFGLAGCGVALSGGGAVWAELAARLLFVPCRMILTVYLWACRGVQELPFSSLICGKPSEGKLWVYYGALVLLLFVFGRRRRRKLRSAGLFARIFVCGILLLAFLCHVPHGGFEVSILDVGQGDGAFLRTSEGVTCFVDGGSTDISGVGSGRMLPFLKSKGVRRIDYWLLSHLDEDHVSGFYEVIEAGFSVGHVVLAERCVRDGAWERLIRTLKQYEVPLLAVDAGDMIRLRNPGYVEVIRKRDAYVLQPDTSGGDAWEPGQASAAEPDAARLVSPVPGDQTASDDRNAARLVSPVPGEQTASNDRNAARLVFLAPDEQAALNDRNAASLVCLFEEQGFRALFTGDIGEEQEERLSYETERFCRTSSDASGGTDETSSDRGFSNIDLYKAAHHGSNYSNSAAFLEALSPRICVVSCARRNRYGHPGAEALARMKETGSRVLCTMEGGQIRVVRRGSKFFVKTAKIF